ncbi:MAG: hypothetical protein HMLIMOIP_002655 [Candidatus Nitrosomirales archaeon]|jgi:hypothetical protein
MKNKEREAKVNEILEDISKHLGNLKASRGNSIKKSQVWMLYARLEHAILLAKLEHDFETVGGFEYSKFDKTSDAEMLEVIIRYLESGKKAFNKGSIKSAINDLRKARDALKLLVLEH